LKGSARCPQNAAKDKSLEPIIKQIEIDEGLEAKSPEGVRGRALAAGGNVSTVNLYASW
jgi:hypothetical protein